MNTAIAKIINTAIAKIMNTAIAKMMNTAIAKIINTAIAKIMNTAIGKIVKPSYLVSEIVAKLVASKVYGEKVVKPAMIACTNEIFGKAYSLP